MDNRRSYLDQLNEGRQRNPSASLEHLSRSLEQLEKQLSMRQRAQSAMRAQASGEYDDEGAERPMDRMPNLRRHDVHESVERFTHEFQSLKAEMLNSSLARQDYIREQVASEMRREFEGLRRELERSYETASTESASRLDKEIARLGKTIQQSREKHDDKSLNLLRLDIEQLKSEFAHVAREDTMRAVSARWEEFERSHKRPDFDQAIDALSLRLEQIGDAVAALPAQISVDQIDAKLRNLAERIEQFVRHEKETSQPEAINAIERRLEEISRSIVAISLADQKNAFEPAMIDRLDARISKLSSQIEDATAESDAAILQKMDVLAERIEMLVQEGASSTATDDIAREIALINERLATATLPQGIDRSIEQLEQRIATLSDRITEQSVQAASDGAILSLQERLDALHTKFDTNQSEALDPALIRALETQLTALSAHLDQPSPAASEIAALGPRIERIEAAVSEGRDQLLESARLAAEEVLRNFAGSPIEAEAVAGLADDLKALESLTRDADDRNTRTFDAIHETLIKIIDRIGQLDTGSHTYIVGEDAPFTIPGGEKEKVDVGHAPSLDMDEVPPLEEHEASSFEFNFEPQPVATPFGKGGSDGSVAMVEPATRSHDGGEQQSDKDARGWSKLFRRKDEEGNEPQMRAIADDDAFTDDDAYNDLDENEPLEPGKAPDIHALIRRVREERPTLAGEGDVERSDFIAAARRAAHAAVAEADLMKQDAQKAQDKPERKSIFANILKARRKTLLLAAAAIISAVAGLQLGKAFVKDPLEIALTGEQPAIVASAALPKTEPARPVEVVKAVEVTHVAPVAKDNPADEISDETTGSINPTPPEQGMAAAMQMPVTPPAEFVDTTVPAPISAPPAASTKPATLLQEIPVKVGPSALRDAARTGDAKAVYVVGTRLAEGAGLSSDMPAASKWFEKSAELGYAPAQYRIGNLYEKGLGVTRDLDKARHWYRLAAGQGNAFAMHNLGVLHATMGENEPAVRWFNKAATLGIKDSQYNLGILAAKGAGTPRNMELAYKWFGVVAATGDADAAAKRDEVAKSMSPAQLVRAKSLVDNWRIDAQDPQTNQVEVPQEWQDRETTIAEVDMDRAVRNVQALLNKAGYDAGMADGLIGNRTRQAIAAFQEDHGLKPTGRIDEHMVRALLAKN